MSLFKYPNSRVWWYDFIFRKRRYRASTKTRSKKLAQEIQTAVKRQCEEGSYDIKRIQASKTFSVACQEYLESRKLDVTPTTASIAIYAAKHLIPAFGRKLLDEITDHDFKKYQQARLQEGAGPRTVNIEFGAFRGILKQAGCWNALQGKIRPLAEPETVGMALNPDQEDRLISECEISTSKSLVVAVTVALSTGMRSDEIKELTWSMVDLKGATLRVGKSKTKYGRNRIIPLNERALNRLKEWAAKFPDRQPDHFVFPTQRIYIKGKGTNKTLVCISNPLKHIGGWKRAWSTARKRAGVTCRFHDQRHTSATKMLEGGVPYPVVASILGWSASTMAAMVKRYGHIGQKSYKKAVDILNGSKPSAKKRTRKE